MAGDILHFNAIRVRAVGTGNLRPTFYGYNDVESEVLVALPMTDPASRELYRLSNFKVQVARLKLETTASGEVMRVNRIVIYRTPLWKMYPA